MATQLARFGMRLSPLVAIWVSLFFGFSPFERLGGIEQQRTVLLLLLPIICLVVLGIYAVGSVLYGVVTFNDCTTARERLINEINEAKQDLARRGIIQKEGLAKDE